ncbi:DUF502 domain-containing protein [Candidatus Aerophobetes bacterium]|uniref:DUF502 domain-containing protein n=1 Tax=Aerophobetes bacterium TaxID=2030807 RepID=A0A523RS21_UNCAE|nr:MAG: DUF502 domain-containing protein [Candidatus Aerophobetes bacterium]
MKRLRNYFITGLITLFPLVVTIIILVYVFQKLDAFLSQLVPPIISTFIPPSMIEEAGGLISIGIKITALLIVLGLITLFGFFTSQVVGRRILDFLERRIFFKIPLISTIYRPIKEINNVLFTGKKYIFKRVVMLEYPRRGVYSIGFVTAETLLETPGEDSPQKILSVFIPTTPNPTSGYLTLIAEKETVPLSIGIQKAFQLIISGGALVPSYKDKLNKAFERKLGRR